MKEGDVKTYDDIYMELLEKHETLSRRQLNKMIAKRMKLPYDYVKKLSEESDAIYRNVMKENTQTS